MKTRVCCKCNINKELTNFPKRKGAKDGIRPYCKNCQSLHHKNYRNKPNVKERIKLTTAIYRDNNKEALKIKGIQYRIKNRDKNIIYSKNYYHANKKLILREPKGRPLVRRDYYEKNKENVLERNRKYSRKQIKEISQTYIIQKLKRQTGLSIETLKRDSSLIQAKTELLKLNRAIKTHDQKQPRCS